MLSYPHNSQQKCTTETEILTHDYDSTVHLLFSTSKNVPIRINIVEQEVVQDVAHKILIGQITDGAVGVGMAMQHSIHVVAAHVDEIKQKIIRTIGLGGKTTQRNTDSCVQVVCSLCFGGRGAIIIGLHVQAEALQTEHKLA